MADVIRRHAGFLPLATHGLARRNLHLAEGSNDKLWVVSRSSFELPENADAFLARTPL